MEIIQIQQTQIQNEVVPSVNARDLHTELNITKHFTQWIEAQIKRADLVKGIDYVSFNQKVKREIGATNKTEYILTLDSAKHIAMMSQSKRAKEIRNYFITIEKKFRQIEKAYHDKVPISEEIKALTKAITAQTKAINNKIDTLEERIDILENQSQNGRPSDISIVPAWLIASDLTANEKLICGTIYAYKDARGYCTLTNADIAQMHSITMVAVKNIIHKLYKRRIIKNFGTKLNRKLKIIRILGR